MSKAAKNEVVVENESIENMDPNTPIELVICDRRNANKEPGTRWGRIKFDADGLATIKVPLKDVQTVHSLGWLSVEDQEKYLGLSQTAEIVASTSEVAELQAQLSATTNANSRLASRNAELEAKLDEVLFKAQSEFKAYQEKINSEMEQLAKDLSAAQQALADAANAPVSNALEEENASLKKQLADAEKENKKLEKKLEKAQS